MEGDVGILVVGEEQHGIWGRNVKKIKQGEVSTS